MRADILVFSPKVRVKTGSDMTRDDLDLLDNVAERDISAVLQLEQTLRMCMALKHAVSFMSQKMKVERRVRSCPCPEPLIDPFDSTEHSASTSNDVAARDVEGVAVILDEFQDDSVILLQDLALARY